MENNNKTVKLEELDFNNLYIKGLWKDCTRSDLEKIFKPYGTILQSRIYGNGVGFVRFQYAHQAANAIRILNGARPHHRSPQALVVKYAIKKAGEMDAMENKFSNNVPTNVSADVSIQKSDTQENNSGIFLHNLPNNCSATDVHYLCSKYGSITNISLIDNNTAFVKFTDRASSLLCAQDLNGKNSIRVKFGNYSFEDVSASIQKLTLNQQNPNPNKNINQIDNQNQTSEEQTPQFPSPEIISGHNVLSYPNPLLTPNSNTKFLSLNPIMISSNTNNVCTSPPIDVIASKTNSPLSDLHSICSSSNTTNTTNTTNTIPTPIPNVNNLITNNINESNVLNLSSNHYTTPNIQFSPSQQYFQFQPSFPLPFQFQQSQPIQNLQPSIMQPLCNLFQIYSNNLSPSTSISTSLFGQNISPNINNPLFLNTNSIMNNINPLFPTSFQHY